MNLMEGVKCHTRHSKLRLGLSKFPTTLVNMNQKLNQLAEQVKFFKELIDQQQQKKSKKRARRDPKEKKTKKIGPKKVVTIQE